MSCFTKKDPSVYPIYFGNITRKALETQSPQLLFSKVGQIAAKKLQLKFLEWRYNLRESGKNLEFQRIENDYRITTKIKLVELPPTPFYQIWVEIKPKLIGTLHLLNPALMAEIDRE